MNSGPRTSKSYSTIVTKYFLATSTALNTALHIMYWHFWTVYQRSTTRNISTTDLPLWIGGCVKCRQGR
ncbi:hypothetical protein BYT27DRAFT_6431014 [Phlegmacium glaucopus]|nr:hypothetical protein BYT27DRAFT_6431014 [Phlegmacium glaucopus]